MTTTIRTDARSLHAWLNPAIRTAASDDYVPVLHAVRIVVREGFAVATSTDRYVASMSRHELPENHGDDADVIVPVRELKKMLTLHKAVRSDNPDVTVTIADGRITMSGAITVSAELLGQPSASTPDIVALFHMKMQSAKDCPGMPPLGLNTGYLHRLGQTAGPNQPAAIVPTGTKPSDPLLVVVGQHYVGLVMPVRLHDLEDDKRGAAGHLADLWADVTGAAA